MGLGLAAVETQDVAEVLNRNTYKLPLKTLSNVVHVLTGDPTIGGRLRKNVFANRTEIEIGGRWESITDEHEARIAVWLDRCYALRVSGTEVTRAIELVASDTKVHPVQDYLTSCPWDGVARLDDFAVDHLRAPDTEVHRLIGRRFLLSCVARAMDPGAKVDTVLILLGEQGMRKSQILASIVPDPSWFSDTPVDLRSKDAFGNMAGVWLYEFAELDSVARQDTNYVKAFLASQKDKYRPPYGKRDVVVPRGVVFCASTNDREFLRDPTGNRRFWPVEIESQLDAVGVVAVRDQLWGEAYRTWLHEGEERRWWFTREEQGDLDKLCLDYTAQHHWYPEVAAFVRDRKNAFTVANVLSSGLQITIDRQTSAQARDVAAILRQLGCRPAPRTREGGAYVRKWVRP